jgi:hypothetical protein
LLRITGFFRARRDETTGYTMGFLKKIAVYKRKFIKWGAGEVQALALTRGRVSRAQVDRRVIQHRVCGRQ